MPKPLSEDLRERVIEAIEGGASRRAAAARFEVSASSAVKWMQRRRQTGSAAAKPSGGCKSLLDEHSEWLPALVAGQPDLRPDDLLVLGHVVVSITADGRATVPDQGENRVPPTGFCLRKPTPSVRLSSSYYSLFP
jgi:hypothetical protein